MTAGGSSRSPGGSGRRVSRGSGSYGASGGSKGGSSKNSGAGARGRAPASKGGRRGRPRRAIPAWAVASGAGLLVSVVVCAGLLWWWGRTPAEGAQTAQYQRVDLPPEPANGAVVELLAEAGLVASPFTFRLYQMVWHPLFRAEPGRHWVNSAASPAELIGLLGRARGRDVVRVTLPEGWDSFQMAERLATAGVCDRDEFSRVVLVGPSATDANAVGQGVEMVEDAELAGADRGLRAGLRGEGPGASYEGRLYPAAYDFRTNTAPTDVVAKLVAEADKRQRVLFETHATELTRLERELGLAAADVVTLASVVEKEAANEAELPLVASVFLNRLRDPDFRPLRMLQSDPTAAYGCKREPELNSCRQFTGKVTAAMLRDSQNPFNTYRHPGLPPTAIGNPSTRAIVAVLTAPRSEYLFFVSPDGGPHRFSRTLEEHERHLR